jgi:hypothetical protein
MKTMKKLQVAVAVATLFAASSSAMAWSISQSGVTIAAEVIAKAPAPTGQVLRAPSVTVNYSNGPVANANSSQDFNITLQLSGDGNPTWQTNAASPVTFRSISASDLNIGNVPVRGAGTTPTTPQPVGSPQAFGIELLGVDYGTTTQPGLPSVGVFTLGGENRTIRYRFRLVNNTSVSQNLGTLQMAFNTVNPLAAPGEDDYAHVATLENSVADTSIGSTVGTPATGTTPAGAPCAEPDKRIQVVGRNFIGSGDGVIGESGTGGATNNGYIQFAQALNIIVGTGVAQNRTTSNTNSSQLDVPVGSSLFGSATVMPLGYLTFANRSPLDAWDTTVAGDYYKYRATDASHDGDFNGVPINQDGDIDLAIAGPTVQVAIASTNGFQVGSSFAIANNPFCVTGPNGAPGTNSGAAGTVVYTLGGVVVPANTLNALATVSFDYNAVLAATSRTALGANGTLSSTRGGINAAQVPGYITATNDKYYVCYVTTGGNPIPQSTFTATASLFKQAGALEQSNKSCPGPFAGLGGGIKIDVRNFYPYNPALPNDVWVGVIRVINNSETTPADLTGQYIRADDGFYGKWGSLGTLAPRAARYFTNREIFNLLSNDSTTAGAAITNNAGSGGLVPANGQGLAANTRLRISSGAASTLRVQSYIYNGTTQALVEVSASQGADFVNIEASPRDHIDQDAQTGIKK